MILNKILLISFVSIFIFYFSNLFGKSLNLYDKPSKHKTHKFKALFVGGIAIQIILLISIKIFDHNIYFINIILASCILALAGFLDDTKKINIGSKFLFQLFTSIIIYYNGLKIIDLGTYNFFGLIELNNFSIIFTVVSILIMINGFNYMDGIDGLASTLFINSIFLISFYHGRNILSLEYELSLIIVYLIFLVFNFKLFKKIEKIFLGNSGSMISGFLIATLAIYYSSVIKIIHPSLIIWSFSMIFFEFLSVNLSRLLRKKKILKPGKDHIHFILKKNFKRNFTILILINLTNIFFGIFGYLIYNLVGETYSLISFVMMFFVFYFIRSYLHTQKNSSHEV